MKSRASYTFDILITRPAFEEVWKWEPDVLVFHETRLLRCLHRCGLQLTYTNYFSCGLQPHSVLHSRSVSMLRSGRNDTGSL